MGASPAWPSSSIRAAPYMFTRLPFPFPVWGKQVWGLGSSAFWCCQRPGLRLCPSQHCVCLHLIQRHLESG